jgi:hypothetical protein
VRQNQSSSCASCHPVSVWSRSATWAKITARAVWPSAAAMAAYPSKARLSCAGCESSATRRSAGSPRRTVCGADLGATGDQLSVFYRRRPGDSSEVSGLMARPAGAERRRHRARPDPQLQHLPPRLHERVQRLAARRAAGPTAAGRVRPPRGSRGLVTSTGPGMRTRLRRRRRARQRHPEGDPCEAAGRPGRSGSWTSRHPRPG